MYISQETAQIIVEEIGRELAAHINYMDQNGFIIASTDASRIGNFHEGAMQIIKNNLNELYVTAEMETPTTRKGLNLPIRIHDEIVGVIGLTGEREQVMHYGNIVRRMTEIMVEDSMLKDERRYDRRVRYRFLEEWISISSMSYHQNFINRGKRLGIDITRPRRAMVILIEHYHQLSDSLEGQRKLENIESSVRHMIDILPDALYLREPPRQICLIPVCDDDYMLRLASKISHMIQEKYNETVFIGIDGTTNGSFCASFLCKEAQHALDCCPMHDENILFYHNLQLEILMNEISEPLMDEYINKLFPNLSAQDLEDYMELIDMYFACEGSIQKISQELFIHKNTVQYKLKKLEDITSKDIRIPSNTAIFMISLFFYKRLHGFSYTPRF